MAKTLKAKDLKDAIINYTWYGGDSNIVDILNKYKLGTMMDDVPVVIAPDPYGLRHAWYVTDGKQREHVRPTNKDGLNIYTPTDVEFHRVLGEVFREVERQHALFVELAKQGTLVSPDTSLLLERNKESLIFEFIQKPTQLSVQLVPPPVWQPLGTPMTLLALLEIELLVRPLLSTGAVTAFSKHQACSCCGRVYQFKSTRAVYCTDACRMRIQRA